jgi:hypothetical protein
MPIIKVAQKIPNPDAIMPQNIKIIKIDSAILV